MWKCQSDNIASTVQHQQRCFLVLLLTQYLQLKDRKIKLLVRSLPCFGPKYILIYFSWLETHIYTVFSNCNSSGCFHQFYFLPFLAFDQFISSLIFFAFGICRPFAINHTFFANNAYFAWSNFDHERIQILFRTQLLEPIGIGANKILELPMFAFK